MRFFREKVVEVFPQHGFGSERGMLGYGDVEYPVVGFVVDFAIYRLGTEGSFAAFDRYVGYELEPAYHFVGAVLVRPVLELHYESR